MIPILVCRSVCIPVPGIRRVARSIPPVEGDGRIQHIERGGPHVTSCFK